MAKIIRPPVVVILGHVDHGKTTLLDYVKKTNRAAKEVGGITQSIGGFEAVVPVKGYATNKITFIDTPGHEAFTKLRARGADVADCALLIIDAVDSVMPQTKESIFHIKNAKIPYIVVVNKTDLPGASIDKVKKDLLKEEVLVEGLGGDVPVMPISAKKGEGVAELLEAILVLTSLHEQTFSPEAEMKAYIIESRVEKGGIAASAIIKDGTLKVGDTVFAGELSAKVRALFTDDGKSVSQVMPSTPFVLYGFSALPEVGIEIGKNKSLVSKKSQEPETQEKDMRQMLVDQKKKTLKVIIKADSQGSLDAVLASLLKNESIEIMLSGVGEIAKSDIFLAKVSKAIVIGFGVQAPKAVSELAEQEKVIIKTYSLIYQLLEELTEVSHIMMEKEIKEKYIKGEAKVMASFIIEKEKIAGIKITKGKVNIKDQIELFRGDRLVGKAEVVSLKHRAKDMNELKKDMEGGILFYPVLDFNIGDVIKSYSI